MVMGQTVYLKREDLKKSAGEGGKEVGKGNIQKLLFGEDRETRGKTIYRRDKRENKKKKIKS